MSQRLPPPIRGSKRTSPGRSSAKLNAPLIMRSGPTTPSATSARMSASLRVVAVHEGLGQVDARPRRRVTHAIDVGGGQRQRLLAQDVLAGLSRLDGPLGVEMIRQRNVDGVDRRIGEQRFVRPMARGISTSAAAARARDASRLAIASIVCPAAARKAGTRLRLIRAAPRMPQRRAGTSMVRGRRRRGWRGRRSRQSRLRRDRRA